MCLILVATGVDLGDEGVKVRVGAQRALGHELLAAGRAFLVAAAQRGDDALLTEPAPSQPRNKLTHSTCTRFLYI